MPLTRATGSVIKPGTYTNQTIPRSVTNGPFMGSTNLVVNPRFANRQGISYPLSVTGGGAYVADQVAWYYNGTGVTRTSNYVDNVTLGSPDLFGIESNKDIPFLIWMNFTQSGTSAGSTYNDISFLLPEVRQIPDGYPITLSFYARSSVTGATIPTVFYGVSLSSGNVSCTFANNITLTSKFKRYTFTANAPTISGTTRYSGSGWSSGGYTQMTYPFIVFRMPYVNGSVATSIDITAVQLELGSVATPFVEPANDGDNCYFYYHILPEAYGVFGWDNNGTALGVYRTLWFPSVMRSAPSCSSNWTNSAFFGSGSVVNISVDYAQLKATYSSVGNVAAYYDSGNTLNSRYF